MWPGPFVIRSDDGAGHKVRARNGEATLVPDTPFVGDIVVIAGATKVRGRFSYWMRLHPAMQ